MQEHLGEEGTGFRSLTLSLLVLPVIDELNISQQAGARNLRLGVYFFGPVGIRLELIPRINIH